jgi:hypothetical protein
LNVPLGMPRLRHALKWFAVVTVPAVRLFCRIDQYCLNVEEDPAIEGWLTRVLS